MAEKKEVKNDYFKIKGIEEGRHYYKHCPGEIIVHLNAYEDIFSKFDPRPFDERSLSDDFLMELRKAAKVKSEEPIHIAFVLNEEKRNIREEGLIRKRLAAYFQRHKKIAKASLSSAKSMAFRMIAIGSILLLIDTYIHGTNAKSFWKNLIIVLTEPAGWFLVWDGFERIFRYNSKKKAELRFYEQIEDARITFQSY